MHLTVVSPFPPTITGIGQYGYHITKAIEESGLFSRITVLAGAREPNGHSSIFKQAEIIYSWQPDQLKARQTILSDVKRLNPDLVWFNLGASVFGKSPLANISGLFTPIQIKQLGIPTVVTLHELIELADLQALNAPGGIFAPFGAKLLTKIATQADVVCLTMNHYMNRLSARGVDCVHIPIGSYQKPELLKESETQELLFFTTLAPFKGLELLLKAFKELNAEFPQLKLSIAGAEHSRFPEYAKNIKEQCEKENNTIWHGQVPEEKVKELFQRAKIVVLPYMASTGSSSVLYQAATWGRSVIASNLEEHLYLSNENNLQIQFFEKGNILDLKQSIRTLLNSTEFRNQQTKHNFNSIQKLVPSETCKQYIQAFNYALEKYRSSKRIATPSNKMEFS